MQQTALHLSQSDGDVVASYLLPDGINPERANLDNCRWIPHQGRTHLSTQRAQMREQLTRQKWLRQEAVGAILQIRRFGVYKSC